MSIREAQPGAASHQAPGGGAEGSDLLGSESGVLTQDQRRAWAETGYLILPGFYSGQQIDWLREIYRSVWTGRHGDVVVDDIVAGRRCRLVDVSPADAASHLFKVNDLYLVSQEMREIVLSPRMIPVLEELLGQEPVLCNTLSMLRGSQQDYHIDSIYMTPRTHLDLIANWIALEDTHPDAGPLRYWPGSHKIPAFRFSDGGYHFIQGEMPAFDAYYQRELEERGLKPELLLAKKGDVVIWHAQLVHGGAPIQDPSRTRDTLVSHFFSQRDSLACGMETIPLNGAYWWRRPHQPVAAGTRTANGATPRETLRALYRKLVPAAVRKAIYPALRVAAKSIFKR